MAINQPIIVGAEIYRRAKCQSPSLKLYMFYRNNRKTVPVGTNLALLQLMWTMLNGSFYKVAGADFPALKANGFSAEESRRIWRAFRQGIWRINECTSDGTTMFCLKETAKP